MRQKLGQFTWRQWLLPRYIDAIGLLVYLVVLGVYSYLIFTVAGHLAYPWLRLGAVIGTILFLLFLDRLEYLYYNDHPSWRPSGVIMLLRLLVVWLVLLTDGKGQPELHFFFGALVFSVLFLIGSSYGLTGLVWLVGLLDRFEATDTTRHFHQNESLFHALLLLGVILIFYVAYLIRQERLNRRRAEQLVRELEESHRKLQAYAAQVAELATTAERNRLAREIHDSLGHYLTVINVQLEKALAFRNRNPEEAEQAVRESKRLARAALQEIRHSVSALRDTPETFSLSQALAELVDNMNTGQFSIALDIQGDEAGFSRHALITLYRAAQEGLTNIQKHAQASRVTVRVRLNAQEADLFIEDNGQGFDPHALTDKADTHYGLQGVRERLELIRGSLKLESAPGQGTSLLITVPKNPLVLVEQVG
ncbi:MAG: sensor histidine kinase [Anaerolineae bacterium]|nr:sensor histidine kinase [Anaerolineae bacterium]